MRPSLSLARPNPRPRLRPGRLAAAALTLCALGITQGAPSAMAQTTAHATAERAAAYLTSGRLAEGRREMASRVAAAPQEGDARLGLGLLEFAGAIERLGQSLHRHGASVPGAMAMPVLRLPVPHNPNPEKLDYHKLRGIYRTLLDDLDGVSHTLADLPSGDMKIPIDLNAIRLDLDGDGKASDGESLAALLQAMAMGPRRAPMRPGPGAPSPSPVDDGRWLVAFDRADALWLRGYTRLIAAFAEFALAYDWHESFEATAHLFFAGAARPEALALPARPEHDPFAADRIADMIAWVHLARFPLAEPQRMKAVRGNLLEAVKTSRAMWKEIMAEDDDEHEWIPNPRQTSRAVTALPVTPEIIDGWLKALDDFEAVLDGRKLIPHFRLRQSIDLRQVLEEPRPFDLVLWLTGHAAVPYLKSGDVMSWEDWNRWNRMLRGNFLGYAVWFN